VGREADDDERQDFARARQFVTAGLSDRTPPDLLSSGFPS
jgi:hypothetical protein